MLQKFASDTLPFALFSCRFPWYPALLPPRFLSRATSSALGHDFADSSDLTIGERANTIKVREIRGGLGSNPSQNLKKPEMGCKNGW
jgi:hypothetical protein